MPTPTKYTGEDLVLSMDSVDISGSARALEVEEETNEIDATVYGSEDMEYITTRKKNRKASFTVLDSIDGTVIENQLNAGHAGTLVYSPEGTGAGKRRKTVACVILRSRKSYPHDDIVQFQTELRLSGAITEGTN